MHASETECMHSLHFTSSPGVVCLLLVMMDVKDDKDENMLGNDENILGGVQ